MPPETNPTVQNGGHAGPPDPTSLAESIERLHIGGPDYIGPGIRGLEKFDPNPTRAETVRQIVHPIQNAIGYLLEQLYELPDGYFGAGGGGKGSGGSGGGGG